MVRENGNAFANAYKYIKEQNEAEASKHQKAIAEAAKKHQDTIDRIYNIRESREAARRNHSKLIEDCKNDALSTIIKAIYIEALCPGSLTDDALFLAESMVDGWIQEKGGASRIIAECRNRTYLLNRICSLTEEVALENVREIEFNESEGITLKEQEEADAEKKEQITQMLAQANSLIAKATALQNGDETVLDDAEADKAEAEKVEDEAPASEEPVADTTEETPASDDVVDASQPVEEEQDNEAPAEDTTDTEVEEEPSDDADLGDIDDTEEETKEEEKAEEEAPEEEPAAEKEEEEDSKEEAEESESEEKEDEEESNDEEEAEFDDDSELTDEEEDEAEEDDNDLSDPDLGDIDDEEEDSEESTEDMEAGEDEDQQDAEAELTGESDDDESVEDEEEVEDTSIDGENTEPQGKIFDELDKEEDVKKAVQLISQRVADAEEDFIQRNAEDKKKIDDLLGKISDNIKTVENLSDNDSTQSKIAQESTMMLRRKIKSITENRPQSVFEKMARKLTENVTKDSDLRSIYLAESGRTDVASVIEHTKVMYGFLEALSVLQLEKVDSAYIENILKNM